MMLHSIRFLWRTMNLTAMRSLFPSEIRCSALQFGRDRTTSRVIVAGVHGIGRHLMSCSDIVAHSLRGTGHTPGRGLRCRVSVAEEASGIKVIIELRIELFLR